MKHKYLGMAPTRGIIRATRFYFVRLLCYRDMKEEESLTKSKQEAAVQFCSVRSHLPYPDKYYKVAE